MANPVGRWTVPGLNYPSSHLVRRDPYDASLFQTRCGLPLNAAALGEATPEPPSRGKTCEKDLRLSRRDG